jgi:hypothetical protein
MTTKYETHVILKAGLGNQMFMLANGYAYSLRYKTNFSVSETWSGISSDRPSYWNSFLTEWKKYTTKNKIGKVYKEKTWSYSNIPKMNHSIAFKGYYQSEEYFSDFRNEILSMFKFPESVNAFIEQKKKHYNINDDSTIVAVHVRRGDYLKLKHIHYVLPLRYFIKAQEKIINELGFRPRFMYVSNDIDWVKENFEINSDDIILEGNKDYEDLALMSCCNHFIISNSSFSWWAAYLGYYNNLQNKNYKSIVIAPDIWFNYAGPKNWFSIYPSEWVVMDSRGYKLEDVFFMGILSCRKYEERRRKQDLSRFKIEYKYFIGDDKLREDEFIEDKDNNIVYVPCPDNYESLPQKVVLMLKWTLRNRPIVKHIIKADDDVKFNYNNFREYCKYVSLNSLNYAGYKTRNRTGYSAYHLGKPENKELSENKIKIPNVEFCAGPCYFLSKKASKIVIENLFKDYTILEDISIGNCLFNNGITPVHLNMKGTGCDWI